MAFRGVTVSLALLAAFVAVGAVRDLASYTSYSKLDLSPLDFVGGAVHGGSEVEVKFRSTADPWAPGAKVVKFYDPVTKTLEKKGGSKCGEGEVLIKKKGAFKCVNKEIVKIVDECAEGEKLEKGPDGKVVCVFSCPDGEEPVKGPDGEISCGLTCPEGQEPIEGPEGFVCAPPVVVFTCPEGFKQKEGLEECEEDVPEVEAVVVPEEVPVVEEPVVEAVVVPEEEAPAPIVEEPEIEIPVEPIPETPVEPTPEVPVEPVPEVPEPVPEVPVEPVPEVPEPVEPAPEVEVEVVPEEPGTCPTGEFFMDKVEAKGCQTCDSFCEDGSCADLVGCGACKPGYFTQREDVDWPYECVKCDSVLPGCAKCKDNITLELGETPQCEA